MEPMNWRQWLGLTPTEADLARELLLAAKGAGDAGWTYDAADSSLRSGDRDRGGSCQRKDVQIGVS
jgi:hypothetical protein